MLHADSAIYLGKEKEQEFSHFLAENNFFIIFNLPTEYDKEEGIKLISFIREETKNIKINNLTHFEEWINKFVHHNNIPSGFSFAGGYQKDSILYVKTTGDGIIYVRRNNKLAKLIEGNLSASGRIQENDLFIFTTKRFIDIAEVDLKKAIEEQNPQQISDVLTPALSAKKDDGLIALILQFTQYKTKVEKAVDAIPTVESIGSVINPELKNVEVSSMTQQDMREPKIPFWKNWLTFIQNSNNDQLSPRKNTITFVAVGIILIILLWSVVLGYQRRSEALTDKKISTSKERITQKLDQAEEVAFLNMERSIILIAEAKEEFSNLKKDIGNIENKEIVALEQLIKTKENQIVKKEDKAYTEFYDLAVEEENAQGTKMYLEADKIAILDPSKSNVYILSLDNKSIEKRSSNELKTASLISLSGDRVIFYKQSGGFYTLEDKASKVITADKTWGNITDLAIYNGNIYALDNEKNEIYKYLAAEEGYSSSSSYFKSNPDVGFNNANSLAIDSSIYVSLKNSIVKFTAGERDSFTTNFPEEEYEVTKVFTTADLEEVYAWDKQKGTIYILGKNGAYERQITSSILKKANDIIVYNDNVYILSGSMIYQMSIE